MCREVRFAHGGHVFGAACGSSIAIYNTYSFERTHVLTGHQHSITSLAWSSDDKQLLSAGMDGAVHEWDLHTGQRRWEDEAESARKGVQYSCAIFAPPHDAPRHEQAEGMGQAEAEAEAGAEAGGGGGGGGEGRALACGNDRVIRSLQHGSTREQRLTSGEEGEVVTQLALSTPAEGSGGQSYLYCALSSGNIRVLPYPLPPEHAREREAKVLELRVHQGAITGLCVSGDGAFVLSCSQDASVYVTRTHSSATDLAGSGGADFGETAGLSLAGASSAQGRLTMLREGFDVGLVVRTQMMEYEEEMEELVKQKQALESDFVLRRRQEQAECERKLQNMQSSLSQSLKACASETKRERALKLELAEGLKREQGMAEAKHAAAVQQLHAEYERKLTAGEHTARDLRDRLQQGKEKLERACNELEGRRRLEGEELREQMGAMKEEQDSVLVRTGDDQLMMKMAFDEHLRQMEDEYEREVGLLQEEQTQERAELKDATLMMKQKNSIMQKKQRDMEQRLSGLASEMEVRQLELKESKKELQETNKANSLLRADVSSRESKLLHKETLVQELKNKIRELEKLKFVQDYQLRAMKAEIEPRDLELERMREMQAKVDSELEDDRRNKDVQEQRFTAQALKMKGLQNEVLKQRDRIKQQERFRMLFSQDLSRIVTSLDPSEWQQPVHALYRKYAEKQAQQGTNPSAQPAAKAKGKGADADAIESVLETQAREWGRQRDFSERRLRQWKHKEEVTSDKARYINNRRVAENSALLRECNELRVLNGELKSRVKKLSIALADATRQRHGDALGGGDSTASAGGRSHGRGPRHSYGGARTRGHGHGHGGMAMADMSDMDYMEHEQGGMHAGSSALSQGGRGQSAKGQRPSTASSVASSRTQASSVFTYASHSRAPSATPGQRTLHAKGAHGGGGGGAEGDAGAEDERARMHAHASQFEAGRDELANPGAGYDLPQASTGKPRRAGSAGGDSDSAVPRRGSAQRPISGERRAGGGAGMRGAHAVRKGRPLSAAAVLIPATAEQGLGVPRKGGAAGQQGARAQGGQAGTGFAMAGKPNLKPGLGQAKLRPASAEASLPASLHTSQPTR